MNNPYEQTNDSPLKANGRFGRLSFIAWNFLVGIVSLFIALIFSVVFSLSLDASLGSLSIGAILVLAIIYIAIIYFNIIFSIRRLHDRNHSGWLVLLLLVPLANIVLALYMLFAPGNVGTNNFGPQRTTAGWEKVLGWIYIIIIPIIFILGILTAIALPSYQNSLENSPEVQLEQVQQQAE